MSRKILSERAGALQKLERIENLMRELGVVVCGAHLTVQIDNGPEYNIGRDQSTFPREVEEPFWHESQ